MKISSTFPTIPSFVNFHIHWGIPNSNFAGNSKPSVLEAMQVADAVNRPPHLPHLRQLLGGEPTRRRRQRPAVLIHHLCRRRILIYPPVWVTTAVELRQLHLQHAEVFLRRRPGPHQRRPGGAENVKRRAEVLVVSETAGLRRRPGGHERRPEPIRRPPGVRPRHQQRLLLALARRAPVGELHGQGVVGGSDGRRESELQEELPLFLGVQVSQSDPAGSGYQRRPAGSGVNAGYFARGEGEVELEVLDYYTEKPSDTLGEGVGSETEGVDRNLDVSESGAGGGSLLLLMVLVVVGVRRRSLAL